MPHFDIETTRLRDEVRAINPALSAKFTAAEDESVDDEIHVTFDGVETGFSVQIGYGYAGANLWNEAEGELWELGHMRTPGGARVKLLPHVATAFRVIG